jgi:hypothetical protein
MNRTDLDKVDTPRGQIGLDNRKVPVEKIREGVKEEYTGPKSITQLRKEKQAEHDAKQDVKDKAKQEREEKAEFDKRHDGKRVEALEKKHDKDAIDHDIMKRAGYSDTEIDSMKHPWGIPENKPIPKDIDDINWEIDHLHGTAITRAQHAEEKNIASNVDKYKTPLELAREQELVSARQKLVNSTTASDATYNKATGYMRIYFNEKPNTETIQEMKERGFRYKPYDKSWSASWNPERGNYASKLTGKPLDEVNISKFSEAKADRLQEAANKHQTKSNQYSDAEHKILDNIPLGQPILVGHHSEKHHRKDLDKANNLMKKSIEEQEIANKYKQRAENIRGGDSPKTIQNRIKKLEAEERMYHRKISPDSDLSENDKEHYRQWLHRTQERLDVERGNYKSSGGIPTDTMNLKVGQRINTRHGLATVTKVSRDTLRVDFDQPSLSGFHKISKSQVEGVV